MTATKKSYTKINEDFIEGSNLELPGVEWVDNNGNTYRDIATLCYFDIANRSFKVNIISQLRANGRSIWNFDNHYTLNASDSSYRYLATGVEELNPMEDDITKPIYDNNAIIGYQQKMKDGLITQAEFFIRMIGYNLYNVPSSLYDFIYHGIAQKQSISF